MSKHNLIFIATSEAKEQIRPEFGIEDRLRCAFKAVHNHWLVTDESEQYIAGIAAVMESYEVTAPERQRLQASVAFIKHLMAGNFDMALKATEGVELLPLSRLWQETGNNSVSEDQKENHNA